MNLDQAEAFLAAAEERLEEARVFLERATNQLHVATENHGYAQRHYDACVRVREDRERVLREAAIADEGGYKPPEEP